MEKKEKLKEKVQQVENENLHLLKVQLYSDQCHTYLTIGASVALVVFSLVSIFYALFFESIMTLNIPFALVGWIGIVVMLISAILITWLFAYKYQKDFKTISAMIEAVKKGQELPPLDELRRWKETKDHTSTLRKFTESLKRNVPTRIGIILGIALYFSWGVFVVIWLNSIMQPEFVLTWLFPDLFLQVIIRLIPSIVIFLLPAYLFLKWLRGIKSTWFFIGASLTSIFYAGQTLVQIAVLYYVNVGWALPDIAIEGYAFPAIFTFKLFRSIFLATLFSIVGYWVEVLKRK